MDNITQSIKDFYNQNANSWHRSRIHPWHTWPELINLLTHHKPLNILDIGCGDGRFARYLSSLSNIYIVHYSGIDISNNLLNIAQLETYSFPVDFSYQDVADHNFEIIPKAFSLIVAFGLMHHIHGYVNRLKLLAKIYQGLEPGGIALVSFWRPEDFSKLTPCLSNLNFETNDYMMSWQMESAARFVHVFDVSEINQLASELGLDQYKLITGSENDKTNVYLVINK